MISCVLQGGLGNQMFQIAATVGTSLKYGIPYGINLNNCYTPNQGFTANKYTNTFFKNVKTIDNQNHNTVYNEPKFSFDEIPNQDKLLIKGYFQSERYFLDYKNEIKNLFYISEEDKTIVNNFFNDNNIEGKKTCVHIRRGDYLKYSSFHNVCNLDYYLKAITTIGDGSFIFVSDDINWVKENFKSENYYFVDFNNELLDFTLMTMCNNVVISNSSFSWWGSYLNNNENKTIISPYRWFGPKGPKDTQDLYLKNWSVIDF